jgi:NAD(P)-dependent dehydrogenase (short-subunit alcohol dehydrogenase family)
MASPVDPGSAPAGHGVAGGRLAGKIAIVTGGSLGIGEAVSRAFVREGAAVLIVSRREAPAARLCEELDEQRARYLAADVGDPATPQRAVDETVRAFGRLDVLVNNAGIDLSGTPLLETGEADMRRVFEVNFFAAARLLQAAATAMRERGGSIVNVTSRTALVGVHGMAVYGASKGALQSLTRTAAVELAPLGIRVNAVAPGLTETPMVRDWLEEQPDPEMFRRELAATIPQGAFATPEDVAAAIVYLAGDESRAVTGASISVDGGYTAA